MSFLTELSFDQLCRLREVVKRVYMSELQPRHCTDREADRLIEALGPKILENQLKQQIDAGIMEGHFVNAALRSSAPSGRN